MIGLTTQTLVVHMIRTRKLPFIKSIASPAVLISSVLAIVVGFLVILTPLHTVFDFAALPSVTSHGMSVSI